MPKSCPPLQNLFVVHLSLFVSVEKQLSSGLFLLDHTYLHTMFAYKATFTFLSWIHLQILALFCCVQLGPSVPPLVSLTADGGAEQQLSFQYGALTHIASTLMEDSGIWSKY